MDQPRVWNDEIGADGEEEQGREDGESQEKVEPERRGIRAIIERVGDNESDQEDLK